MAQETIKQCLQIDISSLNGRIYIGMGNKYNWVGEKIDVTHPAIVCACEHILGSEGYDKSGIFILETFDPESGRKTGEYKINVEKIEYNETR